MIELEKRISGDWFDIREAGSDQYSLSDWFKISPVRLKNLSHTLKLDNENGILEYKSSVLKPVFISLEEMKFQSLSLEELEAHKNPLEELLFVILLQRLICTGVISPRRAKSPEPVSTEDLEINSIIGDIKNRLKIRPEFRKHPAVKNIILQIGIYQKEKQKMRELFPTIKPDKQATFKQNFKEIFDSIFESIRKNYADILAEEEALREAKELQADLFRRLSIKEMASSLMAQAREVSRLRSTLSFAAVDKYKTRESLVRLYREKGEFLKLIDKETRAYQKICSELAGIGLNGCAERVSNRFRDEIIRILDKLSQLEADG